MRASSQIKVQFCLSTSIQSLGIFTLVAPLKLICKLPVLWLGYGMPFTTPHVANTIYLTGGAVCGGCEKFRSQFTVVILWNSPSGPSPVLCFLSTMLWDWLLCWTQAPDVLDLPEAHQQSIGPCTKIVKPWVKINLSFSNLSCVYFLNNMNNTIFNNKWLIHLGTTNQSSSINRRKFWSPTSGSALNPPRQQIKYLDFFLFFNIQVLKDLTCHLHFLSELSTT